MWRAPTGLPLVGAALKEVSPLLKRADVNLVTLNYLQLRGTDRNMTPNELYLTDILSNIAWGCDPQLFPSAALV